MYVSTPKPKSMYYPILSASNKTRNVYCPDNYGGNLKEYKYFGKNIFHM